MINLFDNNKFSKLWKSILRVSAFLNVFAILVSAQDHKSWSYNLNLYEVNTRNYTASGTFNEFRLNHLDRLKEMGVGIIWFMPVNPIGSKNKLGSLGSPYSVKDYFAVNPELGTLEDFKTLVKAIHSKGMFVIIDWVANHTSWDNVLTATNPEWYVKNTSGNFTSPAGTNWSDVIQLDYSKRGLRDYMIGAMSFWVKEVGVDGFRCDAVSFMPGDFWSEANSKLKAINPKLFMLAEDDKYAYQFLGFDMSYAWGMYGFGSGVLKRIASGSNNANDFAHYMHTENISYDQHYRLYFTSNHDENSWYGTDKELFGNFSETFAALTATVGGMQLVYGGQEAGLSKRLAFFDKDRIIWQTSPLNNVYSTLNKLKKENSALWNGFSENFYKRVKTNNEDRLFSFVRKKGSDKIFAVFNLSGNNYDAVISDTNSYGTYEDVFTKQRVSYTQPFSVSVQPYGYKIFKKYDSSTNVEKHSITNRTFQLMQNYPNPFNPSTAISYVLQAASHVTLKVYDVLGREVVTLVNEFKPAGTHSTLFLPPVAQGKAGVLSSLFASGVYFYRLTTPTTSITKKMILAR
ncbi:MAG: glycosidase [Ignavibacteria bacterium]|nr:MAG: glycosidase [Ignavibacteria bacterium]KAF0160664.1 MAG: glycosidase [Ignavibacteria bacterium]